MKIRYVLPFLFLSLPAWADGIGASLTGIIRSATCSQATTFLARTSGLDAAHQAAYRTLICGLVSDNTWTLFDAIYILATQDSTTARLNLVSSSFGLTANGSPTFTADSGYTGTDASSTVWLDPGAALTTYTQYTLNSAHISAWSFTNATSSAGGGDIIGAFSSGFVDSTYLVARYSDGNAYCDINDNNSDSGVANANSTGWYVCDRTDSTHSTLYKNATSIRTPNITSTAVPASANLEVLAASIGSGGGSFAGSALQIGAATAGAHLTSGRVTSVYNRICTFLTTIHGSC